MPHRLFLPREKSRSHILSVKSLLGVNLLLLIIILLRVSSLENRNYSVLGFATNIYTKDLYELTNKERVKLGLAPLKYSTCLEKAAVSKAKDMFKDNYWAHISKDGKEPWDFFMEADCDYIYAGENLAKDFNNSSSVVKAWMRSKTHKANIVNPKYTEIGFAVVDGILDGKETTLVVQLFRAPPETKAKSKVESKPEISSTSDLKDIEIRESTKEATPVEITPVTLSNRNLITINKYYVLNFLYFLFGVFFFALVVDALVAIKRGHLRITGNTFSHLILFIFVLVLIIYLHGPSIG